jgi:hypothetical protein
MLRVYGLLNIIFYPTLGLSLHLLLLRLIHVAVPVPAPAPVHALSLSLVLWHLALPPCPFLPVQAVDQIVFCYKSLANLITHLPFSDLL